MDIDMSADTANLALLGQLSSHSNGISGLTFGIEVKDDIENHLVGRSIKVSGLDDAHDIGDSILAHQHGTEHRLFSENVLRWNPFGSFVHRTREI